MILDSLVLHNFSLYRGRQEISLTPQPGKPVILVGGLNGTGKTTLLDALQLALYGKLARCSTRGTLSYEDFLKDSINRKVDPSEGAAVEVYFRHMSAGVEHAYRVHRSWWLTAKGIRERVEVVVDGKADPLLTDSWSEHVEDFIPARLSHLFFFDGEKIESLANFDSSADLLNTAIHSVLGLDIVDKLTGDLSVLERRKRLAAKNTEDREAIENVGRDSERLDREYQDLVLVRAAAQNEFDFKNKRLHELMLRFQLEGGQAFEDRKKIETDRRSITEALRNVENDLRQVAEGPSPLLFVKRLLSAAAEQDAKEQQSAESHTLDKILAKRDVRIISIARASGTSKLSLESINRYLREDRERRKQSVTQERFLHLDTETRELLGFLRNSVLADAEQQVKRLSESAARLSRDLLRAERALASVPAEDSIIELINERRRLEGGVADAQVRLTLLDEELEKKKRQRDQLQSKLVKQIEDQVETDFQKEDALRMVAHSQQVRTVLQTFRTSTIRKHVTGIERLVLDSFQHLLRKRTLVSELRIDPNKFTVELRNGDGRPISSDRLSAGERQLLAVSLLWGLGRASGRPLPVVTDTPLGRLDASHRVNLVERYFPHASHQMLILSTDEEIDRDYYQRLRPWISRSYRLEFDEQAGGTQVRTGYFWDAEGKN
jgi:DNA sulfur modification protein DndD